MRVYFTTLIDKFDNLNFVDEPTVSDLTYWEPWAGKPNTVLVRTLKPMFNDMHANWIVRKSWCFGFKSFL